MLCRQFQRVAGRIAAGDLAPAGQSVSADQLDDDAQGVRRVEAGRVQQRRVGHGDWGDVDFADAHH